MKYLSFSRSLSKPHGVSTRVPDSVEKRPVSDEHSTGNGEPNDIDSTVALMAPLPPISPPNLKIKRVDYYYSRWSKSWKYKNSGSKVTPEMLRPLGSNVGGSDKDDPWQAFCFVVVRKMPQDPDSDKVVEPTFVIVIKSPYLRKACKDVIQYVPGLSWNADPLEIDPQIFIVFLPHFEEYRSALRGKRNRTTEEDHILTTVEVLVDYIREDYRGTLATIANLTSHGEITYDLLYSILVPRSVLVTECPVTAEPRALQLVSITRLGTMNVPLWDLLCESVDIVDTIPGTVNGWPVPGVDAEAQQAGSTKVFGRVQNRIIVSPFKGTVKINSLEVYPIQFHAKETELKTTLLARGRKWAKLRGTHHMQYKGTGSRVSSDLEFKSITRYNVNSRVMIDRANFKRLNPNYAMPVTKVETSANATPSYGQETQFDSYGQPITATSNNGVPTLRLQAKTTETEHDLLISDDELLLASPIVYGFSLSDKIWFELNVEAVQPIEWNDEAFANLVLPAGRKTLLRSLVEAHNSELGFDDFVRGKGHGLVINLFGPPGVGKTLSAEATSEHLRRPLYVIGGGDLGTSAAVLDSTLNGIFDIATSWKAIVLIDEADVFLEARSLRDLERNAMVAAFLRHVEYYRGILFMTTNRVRTFDEAFLSRIHVALHFRELSKDAKMQVWRAFLLKVGIQVGLDEDFSETLLEILADRNVNGRQIKNATRTANSLAVSRGERIGFTHLVETLDAMEEFTAEFRDLSPKR